MNKIGFIGLGVMGYPMAGHLQSMGNDVVVFNRSAEKSDKWSNEFSGTICKNPSEIASQSNIIMLCVGKDDDVEEVMLGNDGIMETLKTGTTIIDHTTTSAELAKRMNDLVINKGCNFIDAPISGGQAGAESGKLSVMVGGDKEAFYSNRKNPRCLFKIHKIYGTKWIRPT